ncbi:MAG: LamG-like jellyroll fold domain-containing protein [Patescibacteria group bacterium]
MHRDWGKGFTLIELLVVIAIIATLSVIVVLVLQPAELLRAARDSRRLSDLNNINKAFTLGQANSINLGQSNVLYLSLIDANATTTAGTDCGTLGLIPLPTGWSYHCAASSTMRDPHGQGWMPIDFKLLGTEPVLPTLPIDALNATSTGRRYYTYATRSGKWELTATLESSKYGDLMIKDSGFDPTMYEFGTDLSISPFANGMIGYWNLNEGGGIVANDVSGYTNTGTLINSPVWTSGKFARAVQFSGGSNNRVINVGSGTSFDNMPAFTLSYWLRPDGSGLTSSFAKGGGWGGTVMLPPVGSQLIFNVGYSTSNLVRLANVPWVSGAWNHGLITWDGSSNADNVRLYHNGVEGSYVVSVDGSGTRLDDNPFSVFLGNNSGLNLALGGALDEFRIYRRVLSPAEAVLVRREF